MTYADVIIFVVVLVLCGLLGWFGRGAGLSILMCGILGTLLGLLAVLVMWAI